jgi:leucyl-tRNA synthetase
MELANHMTGLDSVPRAAWEEFLKLLSPFAPHIAEELWALLGHSEQVSTLRWPEYDAEKARSDEIEIPVQVNGKLRAKVVVAADSGEEAIREAALADGRAAAFIEGKRIVKVIVVPGRLVNIVVR